MQLYTQRFPYVVMAQGYPKLKYCLQQSTGLKILANSTIATIKGFLVDGLAYDYTWE